MRFQMTVRSLALFITCMTLAGGALSQNLVIPPPIEADQFAADIHLDSLARLPAVQRDDLDARGQEVFDLWVQPGTGYGTGLRGPIGMWMHSPELAAAMFDVRQRVRYETEKDQRLTELTIIATAREISNQYEWSAHEGPARVAGLEEQIIDLVKYRRPLPAIDSMPGFGETERTIIQFAREVVSEEKVSSSTFADAVRIFGREGTMDLVGLIGYYNFVAITLKAFDLQRPPGSELLLPISTATQ